ncbi:outer membrane beta-barrel protein [Flavivirga spongiicola]|uniref:Outer membrane beta-barrel protein n=1 Tax=Flavivirga spongiicola TaxID=421621 RepID=A0ABU7XXV9_9FLAO|nr:outer membrane beta-barrel protein [Flavivirga sp. MEBiC05379]MDO5979699.1 outer membrane beta-barrel protein [Flavivirga sp. MEBiC05379]
MKKNFFFIAVLLCVGLTFSQSKTFEISGTLISETEKLPLEAATIHVERIKDSTLVGYTISDKNGKFVLEDETKEVSLNLFVSYVGYETIKKTVSLSERKIDLGNVILKTDTSALDEIIITSVAPVTIKKDTLEFNANSFKTKKNANVEDLLKKLPGLEVDMDGKIKVNGKDVDKVLVNGKPFFGNDPTITTRNLTKEMIRKVQITDTRTKAEAFAGEEGEKISKTINFTIKEENNKGLFGKIAAGIGTNDRYEFSGMLNSFKKEKQLSVLVGGNNINSPGFSFGELGNFNRRQRGGSNGITTSKNTGANFSNSLSEMIDISGDYFYSESNTESKTITERENILPDSRYFSNSLSSSLRDNKNHKANLDFEIKIDSTFYINVASSFNYSKNERNSLRDETSLNMQNDTINKSNSYSLNKGNNKSFNSDFDITKRFGNNGSFLRLNMSNTIGSNKSDSNLDSRTDFFEYNPTTMENVLQNSIVRNQIVDGNVETDNLRLGLKYRLPIIGKELYIDASYAYNKNTQKNIRNTFDFDEVTQDYNDFINEDLSSDFKYVNTNSTTGVELTYKKEKFTSSLSSSHILRTLDNTDKLREQLSGKQDFKALELGAYINYRFSKTESLRFRYNLRNNSPELSQLQTFEDVSNPLNIIKGNPELDPANNHRFNLRYRKFNFQERTGVFATVNANFTDNQIASKTSIDEDLIRRTTYTNVNGNYNLNAYASLNKSIKIDTSKTIRYRLGFRSGFNKVINFNNDVKYASQNLSFSPNAEVTFSWDEVLELSPNYRLSYNETAFDIDAFQDQKFLTHGLGIRTTTTASKKIDWRNDISFNYNPNVAPGFQKSSWFWNSTVSYSMLKEKGTLTLKVYDLLNQNTNARRIASADYIQDSQSNILKRYFMLNFSWKLNKMGGMKMNRGRYNRGGYNG